MLYAVLLVEDHQPWLDRWTEDILELRDDVLVLCANTIVKAEELFEQCPGVAVIVMDACVPGLRHQVTHTIGKNSWPQVATTNALNPKFLKKSSSCLGILRRKEDYAPSTRSR